MKSINPYRYRRPAGLALIWTLLGSLVAAIPTTGLAATGMKGSFSGAAYGSYANATAGDVATRLGRSAYIASGCEGTGGEERSNTVDSVDAGEAATLENIYNTAYTNKNASSGIARHTSKVEGVSLLDGQVSADTVLAVTRTRADTNSARSDIDGSRFVDLTINGQPIGSNPSQGRRINLDGLGYVILKQVERGGDGRNSSSVALNMITVVVTDENRFGLPIGSKIVIAHARSEFHRREPTAVVGGMGFAALSNSSAQDLENRVGRAAVVYLPCRGTDGKVLSNNIHSMTVTRPSGEVILSSETGRSTTTGGPTEDGALALTTNRLRNVSLFDGQIRAEKVKAVAEAVVGRDGARASTDESRLENLSVLGVPVPTSVPPNTRIDLPGIGYVILKEQSLDTSSGAAKARINMIHVVVDRENSYGVPAGSHLILSSARSSAKDF
jgi:hypothetical protein